MITVDLRSGLPIYEQLYENTRRLILQGILAEDDQLPSVRELSTTLTINPNTIQKAFKALERDGYTYSVNGRGSFVKGLNKARIAVDEENALKGIAQAMDEVSLLNIPKERVLEIVAQYYETKEADND